MVLGKAYLGLEDFEKAESNAKSAYETAVGMKYRWAEGKLKVKSEYLDPCLLHAGIREK